MTSHIQTETTVVSQTVHTDNMKQQQQKKIEKIAMRHATYCLRCVWPGREKGKQKSSLNAIPGFEPLLENSASINVGFSAESAQ